VRIDADAERLASTPTRTPASVDLRADAEPGAVALAAALANVRVPDDERDERHRTRVAEVRATVLQGLAERFPETWAYCRALREVIPEDGILVDEMTQVGYMARNAYPVSQPGTLIGSGYQGTLGFGYSTALGAKVGCPDKPVVSINGDGGFMYGAAELATAVQHGINVVAAVFTDGAYGNVKRIQRLSYGREIASTLHNPDFVRLAESFGVPATRVSDPEAFGPALAEALEAGEPRLIDVSIGEQPEIWGLFMGRERF